MANVKRRLYSAALLSLAILTLSAATLRAQTADAKSKASSSVSGRVTVGDKPAPGISIFVTSQNAPGAVGQATSDAEGNYRINGLPAGQFNISPAAPIYVMVSNPMVNTGANPLTSPGRIINLSANEAVEGIDFKLTRGGVITGRITDGDGRPVVEERINLLAVEENGAPARQPFIRHQQNFTMYQTDDRGVYRIFGLSPGRYKVSIGEDMGRAMRGNFVKTFHPDTTDIARASIVEVTSGGEAKDIDIKIGRRLQTFAVSGRVIDADTNKPLPNLQIAVGMVQQNQGQSYVTGTTGPGTPTNSQGEFRMEGLSPGRYVVTIYSMTFNPTLTGPRAYSDPVPFEVIDGDVANLEVRARQGLTISGVVVPEGVTDKKILDRLSNLVVMANVETPPNSLRVYTGGTSARINPDGSFVLEGLQPGKVSIQLVPFVSPEQGFTLTRIELNGVAQSRGIDLAAGQSLSGVAIFVTYGSGVVRGQIKVEGGVLGNDAMIYLTLQRHGDATRFGVPIDSRGRFLMKNVPAGNYEAVLQINSLGSQITLPRDFPRQQKQSLSMTEAGEAEINFIIDLNRKDGP